MSHPTGMWRSGGLLVLGRWDTVVDALDVAGVSETSVGTTCDAS